jgi:glycerol-3-phosphate dehydrogenase
MTTRNRIRVDVAVVGGGIAGLWIAQRLRAGGRTCVLLERSALGDGQTIRSQGIVHGGLKYALNGTFGAASHSLAGMPSRWRACLEGRGVPNLSGVRVLSQRTYLWSPNDGVLGRLGALVASSVLRGTVKALAPGQRPHPFDDRRFGGVVYELDEFVIDIGSLLERLARGVDVLRADVTPQHLVRDADGGLRVIRLSDVEVVATNFVLAAGAGNGDLSAAVGARDVAMQRRPLCQVIVRGDRLPALFGHCLPTIGNTEPRLTITTHTAANGERVWYLGGRLANDGVRRDDADQIRHAREELAACVPWIDVGEARFDTLRIDRAEARRADGARPDDAFAAAAGNVLICWPTKLALAPDLGDRAMAALTIPASRIDDAAALPDAAVGIAAAPWDR